MRGFSQEDLKSKLAHFARKRKKNMTISDRSSSICFDFSQKSVYAYCISCEAMESENSSGLPCNIVTCDQAKLPISIVTKSLKTRAPNRRVRRPGTSAL